MPTSSAERYDSAEEWSDRCWANQDEDADLPAWRRHVLDDEDRFRRFLEVEPERQISGEWWSTPVPSGVRVTSRARENLGAVELLLAEDDISDGRHARVWPVHVDDAAQVYEITGPTPGLDSSTRIPWRCRHRGAPTGTRPLASICSGTCRTGQR